MSNPLIEKLTKSLKDLNDRAGAEKRHFTAAEQTHWDTAMARIDDLKEADKRSDAAARHRMSIDGSGNTGNTRARFHVGAEDVYQPDNGTSFFRDLNAARLGDFGAGERLHRNNEISAREVRAGDMTSVANGSFAPPLWIVDEWIALARPGRITADLMVKQTLPAGISSVNLPKITSGTSTAVQVSQNTQIADTAVTTASVTSGISTIAGQQIVSTQLIAQGGTNIDKVILADLAQDHARALDAQVISGTGAAGQLRGLLNGAGVGSTTFTTATPKVIDGTTPANSYYNALVRARNAIATTRFLPATAIVLSPTRWSWILEALDSSNRPLVLSSGGSFNPLGVSCEITAEGACGTLLGLPVYQDAGLPSNLGAGTNQDVTIVLRAPDCYLWETDLSLQSFDATYANQMSILLRASSFSALITDRFGASVNVVSGTGCIVPTL